MDTSVVLEAKPLEADEAARLFAALGDPARLRILAVLSGASLCVCEIQAAVPMAPNLLSYHLRVLREVGLIEGVRRGRWIDYHIAATAGPMLTASLAAAGLSVLAGEAARRRSTCGDASAWQDPP